MIRQCSLAHRLQIKTADKEERHFVRRNVSEVSQMLDIF